MEFVDGKDLFKLMYEAAEREISLPLGVVLYIAEAVALGLNYCHSKKDHYGRPMNLVHRDISPQNVFISWEGEVKLLDFGIAKVSNRNRQTEAGVIKGKLQYMSPEQLNGEGFDHRSDLFSAGICIYEMLAGEMAYQEDDTLTLLRKIREADVSPLETLRPDLPPSIIKWSAALWLVARHNVSIQVRRLLMKCAKYAVNCAQTSGLKRSVHL